MTFADPFACGPRPDPLSQTRLFYGLHLHGCIVSPPSPLFLSLSLSLSFSFSRKRVFCIHPHARTITRTLGRVCSLDTRVHTWTRYPISCCTETPHRWREREREREKERERERENGEKERRAFKALAPLSQTVISILTETVPAVLSRKNSLRRMEYKMRRVFAEDSTTDDVRLTWITNDERFMENARHEIIFPTKGYNCTERMAIGHYWKPNESYLSKYEIYIFIYKCIYRTQNHETYQIENFIYSNCITVEYIQEYATTKVLLLNL